MNQLNHSSTDYATQVQCAHQKMFRMSTLADRIIEAMAAAGLDRTALATRCGVSYQAVRKLTLGESQSMDGKTLICLAKASGFEAEWIMTGSGPKHRTYARNEPQSRTIIAMESLPESEQYKIPEVVALFTNPK